MAQIVNDPSLSFPAAQQAQIIRANQRDLYHVSSLKEQTDMVFRSWLGTRWLTRWEKEVDLFVKLGYHSLTTGRAIQTLGEEYTDIWQISGLTGRLPSIQARAVLIALSTLPPYILSRWHNRIAGISPALTKTLKMVPSIAELVTTVNLAIFYFRGRYYDITKRFLGIRHASTTIEDPRSRPPSYALLGVLLGVQLLHRLRAYIQSKSSGNQANRNTDAISYNVASPDDSDIFLDDLRISTIIQRSAEEAETMITEDEHTMLDVMSIPTQDRAGRTCTLCLEERKDSTATECGHLFCWSCIVGWGREKAECPLCRQSLTLNKLLPVYAL